MDMPNVDLNSASLEELSEMDMIGRKRAEDLIQEREKRGGFKEWKDLKQVPGFSEMLIEDLKDNGATI